MNDVSVKELMEKQDAIRANLMAIRNKYDFSWEALAKDMKMPSSSVKLFLVSGKDVGYRQLYKINQYCLQKAALEAGQLKTD